MSYKHFTLNIKRHEEPLLIELTKSNEDDLFNYVNLLIDFNIIFKSKVKFNIRKINFIKKEISNLETTDTIEFVTLINNIKKQEELKEILYFYQNSYNKYLKKLKNSYNKYQKINSYFKEYIQGEPNIFLKNYHYTHLKNIIVTKNISLLI